MLLTMFVVEALLMIVEDVGSGVGMEVFIAVDKTATYSCERKRRE